MQTINILWLDGQISNTLVSCTEWKANIRKSSSIAGTQPTKSLKLMEE